MCLAALHDTLSLDSNTGYRNGRFVITWASDPCSSSTTFSGFKSFHWKITLVSSCFVEELMFVSRKKHIYRYVHIYIYIHTFVLCSIFWIRYLLCSFVALISTLRHRMAPDTRYGARACAPRPWKCRSEIDCPIETAKGFQTRPVLRLLRIKPMQLRPWRSQQCCNALIPQNALKLDMSSQLHSSDCAVGSPKSLSFHIKSDLKLYQAFHLQTHHCLKTNGHLFAPGVDRQKLSSYVQACAEF